MQETQGFRIQTIKTLFKRNQMSGISGKSGGRRAGSGRKKKPPEKPVSVPVSNDCDMLKFLQDVALGRIESNLLQVRAAIAAVQYTHIKKGDGGIKDEKKAAAKVAATGHFAPGAPPKLVYSK